MLGSGDSSSCPKTDEWYSETSGNELNYSPYRILWLFPEPISVLFCLIVLLLLVSVFIGLMLNNWTDIEIGLPKLFSGQNVYYFPS